MLSFTLTVLYSLVTIALLCSKRWYGWGVVLFILLAFGIAGESDYQTLCAQEESSCQD